MPGGKWITKNGRRIFLSEEAFEIRFNSKQLTQKYDKHVIRLSEFGNITKEQYKELAVTFMKKDDVEIITSDGGSIYKYSEKTNEFGKLDDKNRIITYFKPKDKEKYWERQKKRHSVGGE